MAWSKDPWWPRQVTLLLRTPAPQLTEHCKDQAISRSLSLPRGAMPGWTAGGPLAWRADSILLPMSNSHAQRG